MLAGGPHVPPVPKPALLMQQNPFSLRPASLPWLAAGRACQEQQHPAVGILGCPRGSQKLGSLQPAAPRGASPPPGKAGLPRLVDLWHPPRHLAPGALARGCKSGREAGSGAAQRFPWLAAPQPTATSPRAPSLVAQPQGWRAECQGGWRAAGMPRDVTGWGSLLPTPGHPGGWRLGAGGKAGEPWGTSWRALGHCWPGRDGAARCHPSPGQCPMPQGHLLDAALEVRPPPALAGPAAKSGDPHAGTRPGGCAASLVAAPSPLLAAAPRSWLVPTGTPEPLRTCAGLSTLGTPPGVGLGTPQPRAARCFGVPAA